MMKWSVVGIALVAATQLWAQVPPMPDAGDAPNHPGMHMPHADAEPKDADAGAKDDKPADLSVTHHALKMNGQTIRYTATAGTLPMRDDAEKITASMFFVAYTKDAANAETQPAATQQSDHDEAKSVGDPARPITFIFNGGPGAAAVWLHLGTAGPKRVALGADDLPPTPPGKLIDNDQSWLDASDLVFIDPVGTGFSRATTPDEGRKFYDTHGDIVSVGEFIRIYCTRFDRWESPKFIAGESYGTTRAAGLANFLAQREGINLNGVILISSVLSFQAIQPSVSNETPFALYLPSYTAVALYHKRLAADLEADQQKTIRAAEDFAVNAYLPALTMGNHLDGTQRNAIAEQLSRFTGLSKQVILDNDLRVSPERFEKSLLADQHEVIGRFDGRMTAPIADNASEAPPFDPSLGPYLGEYTATFNQYIRHDLHFKSDLNYEVLSNKVHPWNFGDHGEGYLYTGDDLADAMTQNPHLKLLVCAAWQDLATPFFAADYVVDHLPIPPERKANITQAYFPGGHMLYHDAPNLVKLHDTISKFITDAVAP